jgi:copper(I)-binding protein
LPAAFSPITNTSDTDDRLVGAASDVAGHMEA